MKTEFLFAMSRASNVAEPMTGFVSYEHLQGAFHCGIRLSNGESASGIGRCKSAHDFLTRAERSKTQVLLGDDFPAKLEISSRRGCWTQVSPYIWRSWAGQRRVDGKTFAGTVYFLGTQETAK